MSSYHKPESERKTPAWMLDALCRSWKGPNIWYPDSGHAEDIARAAKLVCKDCPVRFDCLDYAVEHNIVDGIWGGLSRRERQRLRGPRRGGTT